MVAMKAAVTTRYGPPDVVRVMDTPGPTGGGPTTRAGPTTPSTGPTAASERSPLVRHPWLHRHDQAQAPSSATSSPGSSRRWARLSRSPLVTRRFRLRRRPLRGSRRVPRHRPGRRDRDLPDGRDFEVMRRRRRRRSTTPSPTSGPPASTTAARSSSTAPRAPRCCRCANRRGPGGADVTAVQQRARRPNAGLGADRVDPACGDRVDRLVTTRAASSTRDRSSQQEFRPRGGRDGGWFGGFGGHCSGIGGVHRDANTHAAIDAACRLGPRTEAPTVLRGLLHSGTAQAWDPPSVWRTMTPPGSQSPLPGPWVRRLRPRRPTAPSRRRGRVGIPLATPEKCIDGLPGTSRYSPCSDRPMTTCCAHGTVPRQGPWRCPSAPMDQSHRRQRDDTLAT